MKKITRLFLIVAAIFTWSGTAVSQNTDCLGVTNLASQGSFTDGYIYSFTTVGTTVTVNFELLDNKTGLVAFIQTYNPGFNEVAATNTSGKKFTKTFQGQILGDTFKVACKFAYTGSMVVTKTFNYVVGSSCSNTLPDTAPPTLFTVKKGAVSYHSVELLLNATDNSGNVIYKISNGKDTFATTGISGVDKSYIISGLTADKNYTFSVSAKDISGNEAANSPILFNATTQSNASNECTGSYTDAQQGSFVKGYNYTFTTSGTDVTVTFELLDSEVGTVAYAWTYNPNFSETQMNLVSGQKYSKTFTGQTIGSSFNVACKFAFSGGMSVTKTLTYTVGNSCGGTADITPPTGFTATLGAVTSGSVEILLNGTDDSGAVAYSVTYGTTTLTTSSNSGVQKSFIVTGLNPSTGYTFSVTAKDASGNTASNSPFVVDATTTAVAVPTTPAPTPPAYDAANVISIFSDAFTNVDGTDYNPNWGQSTVVSTIQIGQDNVLEYSNLNYQGTQFGSHVNASAMKYLHIDVWTVNETSIQIYPIMNGDAIEKFYQVTPLKLNQWNSYDIPLTEFTSQGLDLSDLIQFKIVGSGGKIVFIDNLYFSNEVKTGLSDVNATNGVQCYPNPVANKLIISAKSEISQFSIHNLLGQSVKSALLNGLEKTIDLSELASGNYFITIKLANGQLSTQKIVKL
jgi:hypothetical protein